MLRGARAAILWNPSNPKRASVRAIHSNGTDICYTFFSLLYDFPYEWLWNTSQKSNGGGPEGFLLVLSSCLLC